MKQFLKKVYNDLPVLVTGGAGFIGSHLVEALVELGARVTVLDNLTTGNIKNLQTVYNKIHFIEGDILNLEICKTAALDAEKIFHLAAIASVPACEQDPTKSFSTNIEGTFNVLEAARLHGVKTVVFSSSSAVYGSSATPCTEDQAPRPSSVYGYAKLMGEQLLAQYQGLHGLHTVSLRYFNVYGKRQSLNAVVPAFKHALEHNMPIKLQGTGLQRRDFVHVSKIVEANLLTGGSQKASGIYNIASGTSITLLDMLEQLKQEYPAYAQQTEFLPARPGDIMYSAANCEKYKEFYAIMTQNR